MLMGHFRKTTKGDYKLCRVSPSVRKKQLGYHRTNFHREIFLLYPSRNYEFVKCGQKYQSTSHGAPHYVCSNISIYCYRKDRSFV